MPTTTTNYSLLKPLVNNATDQDLWGGYLNDDMDDIDGFLRAGITVASQSSQTTSFAVDASISVKKLYPCDDSGGSLTATLPLASVAANGATVYFKKTNSSVNSVTIAASGADTIDGATSRAISSQYDAIGLVSDGISSWRVLSTITSVPTGSMSAYAGTTAPGGWLLCYGQAISRTTYAALFAAISTSWGSGDGSTTFNVPDMRGRIPAGRDDMGGVAASRLTNATMSPNGNTVGATGGEQTHTLIIAEMPSHTHTVTKAGRDGTIGQYIDQSTSLNESLAADAINNTGGDGAHNNVQPTAVVNWIIKT